MLFLIYRIKNLKLFQSRYFYLPGEKCLLIMEGLNKSHLFSSISTIHFASHTGWTGLKAWQAPASQRSTSRLQFLDCKSHREISPFLLPKSCQMKLTKESPPPFWVALKFFKPFSPQNQNIDYKKHLSIWQLTIFLFKACGRLLKKVRNFQAPRQYQNIPSTQV